MDEKRQTRKRPLQPLVVDERTDKLSKAQLDRLIQRLQPGGSSIAGFLSEKDDFLDLIRKDTAVLEKHNITHRQVADRMRQFIHYIQVAQWFKKFTDPFVVMGKYKISLVQTKGMQHCPFYNTCKAGGSMDITVSYGGRSVMFGNLLPHLIECHRFFEGHTAYRVDPLLAIQVLEIEPNTEYPIVEDVFHKSEWKHYASDKPLPKKALRVETKRVEKGNRIINTVHYTWRGETYLHVSHTDVDAHETHAEFNSGERTPEKSVYLDRIVADHNVSIELPRFDIWYEDEDNWGVPEIETDIYRLVHDTIHSPPTEMIASIARDNNWDVADYHA